MKTTTSYLPKVSIVIPVYNGADYLRGAIDSALAQTYQNVEILVVNDGSNDGGATERIAVSYGQKIRYFSKLNGGVASALNLAIEEMSGDYFSWLSHDDLYTQDKVEKEMSTLSEIGRDDVIVYSDYSVFTRDPEDAVPIKLKGVASEHFRYWITVENRLHGCTLLIPRLAFMKVGGFNENLRTTQDYDLWFRMAKEFSFIHVPESLVKARSHPDQGTLKMAGIALSECNDLLAKFVRELSPGEILSATSKPLGKSYAEIASSMFYRGFYEAGKVAVRFTRHTDRWGYIRIWFTRIRVFLRRIEDRVRRLFPRRLKQLIKVVTWNRSMGSGR